MKRSGLSIFALLLSFSAFAQVNVPQVEEITSPEVKEVLVLEDGTKIEKFEKANDLQIDP